jgi:hypothetical protein
MKIDVEVPQARLAPLLADPELSTKWMDDVDRVEPISGLLGMQGSRYRLVPKPGGMEFVATVVGREIPAELRVSLEGRIVTVAVTARFAVISPTSTRLTHVQAFNFKGLFNRIGGLLARGSIKQAQRRHLEAFKRYAETGR